MDVPEVEEMKSDAVIPSGTGGKLEETLTTHRRVLCAMYSSDL